MAKSVKFYGGTMFIENGIGKLVDEFISNESPSPRRKNISEIREGYELTTAFAGETESRVVISDIEIDGLKMRIFSPIDTDGPLPAAVYYHGGCFISGGFSTHDNQLREMSFNSKCKVIAIQYRLAPENIFPAAHDDAEKGANLVWKYSEELGVNPQKIVLMGDSAGGHLTLVTGLRLKNSGLWQPSKIILIYPMVDRTLSFKSHQRNGKDYIVTTDLLSMGYEMYMPNIDPMHSEVSPLWRGDFNGLPPVHIISAEYDPLCDEDEELYRRMISQDVTCTCQRWLGVTHGFFQFGGISSAGHDVVRDLARRIASAE